jgi:hypothetical protein
MGNRHIVSLFHSPKMSLVPTQNNYNTLIIKHEMGTEGISGLTQADLEQLWCVLDAYLTQETS